MKRFKLVMDYLNYLQWHSVRLVLIPFALPPLTKKKSPTPPNITTINEYPAPPTENQQYVHYKSLLKPVDPINGYQIMVHMYSTMSTVVLKKRVLPILQDYNMWMDSDAIWWS